MIFHIRFQYCADGGVPWWEVAEASGPTINRSHPKAYQKHTDWWKSLRVSASRICAQHDYYKYTCQISPIRLHAKDWLEPDRYGWLQRGSVPRCAINLFNFRFPLHTRFDQPHTLDTDRWLAVIHSPPCLVPIRKFSNGELITKMDTANMRLAERLFAQLIIRRAISSYRRCPQKLLFGSSSSRGLFSDCIHPV